MGLITADPALAEAVAEQFRGKPKWQLAVLSSLQEALSVWDRTFPSLLFWDVGEGTPDKELVATFAQKMNEKTPAPWLMMLGNSAFVAETLDISDQWTRPLRLGMVLSRIQFYEKMLQQPPDRIWKVGPWLYHNRTHTLREENGTACHQLTGKEAALLTRLLEAAAPRRREEILEEVWGYNDRVDTHTLETHIYRLRRKLLSLDGAEGDCFLVEQGNYSLRPEWRSE